MANNCHERSKKCDISEKKISVFSKSENGWKHQFWSPVIPCVFEFFSMYHPVSFHFSPVSAYPIPNVHIFNKRKRILLPTVYLNKAVPLEEKLQLPFFSSRVKHLLLFYGIRSQRKYLQSTLFYKKSIWLFFTYPFGT